MMPLRLSAAAALLAASLIAPLSAPAQTLTPAGQPVLSFINRLLIDPPQVLVYGYFPTVAGIPGPLFAGTPGESTAYFTWTLGAPAGVNLQNGAANAAGSTSVTTLPAGEALNVYYNATPNQDWNVPATFSAGVLVATFHSAIGTQTNSGPVSLVTQSYAMASSSDFNHKGVTYKFRWMIPHGITMMTQQHTDEWRGGTPADVYGCRNGAGPRWAAECAAVDFLENTERQCTTKRAWWVRF